MNAVAEKKLPPGLALDLNSGTLRRIITLRLTSAGSLTVTIWTRAGHGTLGKMLAYASTQLPDCCLHAASYNATAFLRLGEASFDLTDAEYERIYEAFAPSGLKLFKAAKEAL